MKRGYVLPHRCPIWTRDGGVGYVGLQPWWRDPGGEHPDPDINAVLYAMEHRRRRVERVLRALPKETDDDPVQVLIRALDAPDSPLLLESWVPGPSGRHWALYILGAGGRLIGWTQLPRLRPDRRRLRLHP